MNKKILFMIYNGEIKFLQDENKDHKEWFLSLGGKLEDYDNTIRGFIMENKIIFFKANLSYDQDVINMASACAPIMKEQLKNPNLTVWCGIMPGQDGAKWEPIMELKTEELTGFKPQEKEEEKEFKIEFNEAEREIVEFKNDYEDPKFIKLATKFTIVMIGLTILSKIILILLKRLDFNSGWNVLLMIAQIVLLILTLIGYKNKNPKAKFYGLAASLLLVFMFELPDIIIAIVNLLFTLDQGYILKAIEMSKQGVDKSKDALNKIKEKK